MDEYTLEKLATYFDDYELDEMFGEDDYGMDKTAAYEEELGEVMGIGYNDEMEKIAALLDGDPAAEYYEAGRELALEELGLEKDASVPHGILSLINNAGSRLGALAGKGAAGIAGLAKSHPTLSALAHGTVPFGLPAAVGAGLLIGRKRIGRAAKGLRNAYHDGVWLNNRVTGRVLTSGRKARDAAAASKKARAAAAIAAKRMRNRTLAGAAGLGLAGGAAGGYLSKHSYDVESTKNAIKMAILNGQI